VSKVHKIAKASSFALSFIELSAAGFTKVRHGRVLWGEHTTSIVSARHGFETGFSVSFITVLDVHVAKHVVPQIFDSMELLYLPKLGELLEDLFVELFKMVLRVRCGVALSVRGWRDVQMRDHKGLRECGTKVVARTAVAVAASTDFEVERAVDLVFLSPDDS